jgi:hypothetical protein
MYLDILLLIYYYSIKSASLCVYVCVCVYMYLVKFVQNIKIIEKSVETKNI